MSLKNKAENEPLEMTSLHLQVRYHKLTMTGKRTHAPPLSCLDTASHNYAGILSPLRRKKAFIVKWHALGPSSLQMQGVLRGGRKLLHNTTDERLKRIAMQDCSSAHARGAPAPKTR